MKLIRNWRSKTGRNPRKFSIQCDDAGLVQTVTGEGGGEVIQVAWDQVARVFAYKRDLFSVDQICFVIECAEFGIEVREGDAGYENLIAQMLSNIPGFPARNQWWEEVALPPFAQNWTKIYSRESNSIRS